MVTEGRIPDPELLYYLRYYEVQKILESRSPALISK